MLPILWIISAPLKHRAEISKVIQGEACVIQAPDARVTLQVPKGIYGKLFGTVPTSHQQFLHLIPDSDCLVCPVCEYEFHPDEEIHSPEGMFKLIIPHIVKHIEKVRGHIRVRKYNTKDGYESISDISQSTNITDGYWSIYEKYITIFTKHFCKFLITA